MRYKKLGKNLKVSEIGLGCMGASVAQIALGWIMAQNPNIIPIPGTTKPEHLAENIGSADVKFTPEELTAFDAEPDGTSISGDRCPPEYAKRVGR